MNDMLKMYGMDPSQFPTSETLILNSENELVKYLEENPEGEYAPLIARQLYDLAMMSHKPLDAAGMSAFAARSLAIMKALIR